MISGAEEKCLAISPRQVIENLQFMFGNIRGNTPSAAGLSVLATWVVLGGPVWHLAPRRFRIWRIKRRLKNSRIDLFQDMARIRGIVYAGYYGHWLDANDRAAGKAAAEDANRANPVLNAIGFTLPRHHAATEYRFSAGIERRATSLAQTRPI